METEKEVANKNTRYLITPSWLSGLIAVVAGLVVVVGVNVVLSIHGSPLQQLLISWQDTSKQSALTLPGESPPSVTNSLQNTWPLLVFWGIIGAVVYVIVTSVTRVLANFEELKNELNYVHARRNLLVKNTVEYLLVRLAAAVLWLVFAELFFKRIVPYSITAAYASAANILSLNGLLYAGLSFVMIVGSFHIHAVFARLLVGRPRIFTNAVYDR